MEDKTEQMETNRLTEANFDKSKNSLDLCISAVDRRLMQEYLEESPDLQGLESTHLNSFGYVLRYTGNCLIGDHNIQVFINIDLPYLQYLWLYHNCLTSNSIARILLKKWDFLKFIHIGTTSSQSGDNQIDDEGFKYLNQRQLPSLKIILANKNILSGNALLCFLQVKQVNLTQLTLSFNKIGVAGMKLLVKAKMMYLQTLILIKCQLGNQGSKQLWKSLWPSLKTIGISSNNLQLDGYLALISISSNSINKVYLGNFISNLFKFVVEPICIVSLVASFKTNQQLEPYISNKYIKSIVHQIQKQKQYRS